ncbi:MAG: phenylpyruvate tautomerase MIF-related protein [Myxococcota bacterium]|jgi:phenylpyruvate tautomerase PptA (4-oxalocrotonate tautomerase family)|nr:phenylpyruvate tautomerase MIF-related protein [Myxococcota bacterium]
MPLLKIMTNVQVDASAEVLEEATQVVASMLGKPTSYVQIVLQDAQSMAFAGTTEPCAYLELHSLGLPEAQTESMSQSLCGFVTANLRIAANRTYIQFCAPDRHLWGWDAKTFA